MTTPALRWWLIAQAMIWLAVLAATPPSVGSVELAGWIGGSVGVLAIASYAALWRVLGAGRTLADGVTLARFVGLLAICTAAVTTGQITWLIWIGMIAVVCSDLLDGWCARRFGASEEGAILDMETDQFTTLGFALVAATFAGVGVWILLLPAFKYANILFLVSVRLPAHDPKPRDGDNRRGRIICALVLACLLACMLPDASNIVKLVASGIAVVALGYSFGVDALYLVQRRGRRPSAVR